MTHGSLFSGIGGFDLAAEALDWENKFHCEWNPFGQRVLRYYWPKSISYDDIKKTNFNVWRGRIDVLSGGFPCQPYSAAGKRLGKEDERHLWPEMLRAVSEIQPGYVVGENVRGLINWNGGMVFDEVQADLEALGYEVLPFLLPACGIGAPHQRYRVWFVAYSRRFNSDISIQQRRQVEACNANIIRKNESEFITDSENSGQSTRVNRSWKKQFRGGGSSMGEGQWDRFPTQSPICHGNDGLSSKLDGITFPKWRTESLMAGGNAIVPGLALKLFKVINILENEL